MTERNDEFRWKMKPTEMNTVQSQDQTGSIKEYYSHSAFNPAIIFIFRRKKIWEEKLQFSSLSFPFSDFALDAQNRLQRRWYLA